ncbi:Exosome complex exonuclease dis3 [Penicillium verhagenii]|nr:Exosome complex exonuclease dis3 [Penicillium verhagenii]
MSPAKVFVRSTKSGKVQKIVRELYLRQDIPCSSKLCSLCPSIAPADANGNNCPRRAPKPVLPLYNRLLSLIKTDEKRFYLFFNEFRLETHVRREPEESINDRNDRAVRTVASWYSEHLRASAKKGKKEKSMPAIVTTRTTSGKPKPKMFLALSLSDYVAGLEDSEKLLDMISEAREARDAKGSARGQLFYPEYYSMSKLRLVSGQHAYTKECSMFRLTIMWKVQSTSGADKPLLILGRDNSNRAIAGG